ncbi:helix-turn-helix domain-containing protein, partial [Burkholderia sp. LMG 13014]|uniref:helix-turn-helix domain-containing protein n=1 Tax=Burkholderia sp. LMG 13014 TaxID=2709306 RepID=UPI001F070083
MAPRPVRPALQAVRYNGRSPVSGTPAMLPADTPTLRAFALLEHLVQAGDAVSLADLARAVDIPKASLHRMLASLEAGGLV